MQAHTEWTLLTWTHVVHFKKSGESHMTAAHDESEKSKQVSTLNQTGPVFRNAHTRISWVKLFQNL